MKTQEPNRDDDLLRALFSAAATPLPDNGFSQRVLSRLMPAPRFSAPPLWWGSLGGIIGMGIAAMLTGRLLGRVPDHAAFEAVLRPLIAGFANPVLGTAAGVTVVSVLTAWYFVRQYTPTVRRRWW